MGRFRSASNFPYAGSYQEKRLFVNYDSPCLRAHPVLTRVSTFELRLNASEFECSSELAVQDRC